MLKRLPELRMKYFSHFQFVNPNLAGTKGAKQNCFLLFFEITSKILNVFLFLYFLTLFKIYFYTKTAEMKRHFRYNCHNVVTNLKLPRFVTATFDLIVD